MSLKNEHTLSVKEIDVDEEVELRRKLCPEAWRTGQRAVWPLTKVVPRAILLHEGIVYCWKKGQACQPKMNTA